MNFCSKLKACEEGSGTGLLVNVIFKVRLWGSVGLLTLNFRRVESSVNFFMTA